MLSSALVHMMQTATKKDLVKLNVMAVLNEKYGICEGDFLSAELCLIPSF